VLSYRGDLVIGLLFLGINRSSDLLYSGFTNQPYRLKRQSVTIVLV